MDVICLHHNDADGRASGAIVKHAFNKDVDLYEMNYGDLPPWSAINNAQKIIVVDFSLPKSDMQKLAQGRELIWIDHHKTAMQEMQGVDEGWLGLRSLDEAACVLTWQYFFPDIPVPRAIVLIGDRDIWRWAEEQTGEFSEGLFNRNAKADNNDLWIPLLDDDTDLLNEIIQNGSILRQAQLLNIERKVAQLGQEVQFEGHKTLMVNMRGMGEMGEHINKLGYDIGYCYVDMIVEGNLLTKVTLYSKTVDVSQIARKYGGGGHAGAAGFAFERALSPFPPDSI